LNGSAQESRGCRAAAVPTVPMDDESVASRNRLAGGVRRFDRLTALMALMLLSVIWGYNWVVMKVALRDCGPLSFGAMRTFFGALVLLFVLAVRGKRVAPPYPAGVVLLGLLQTTGFIGFMMWALVSGGAGKTAVLVYTMPFWTLLLARLFLRERLRGVQWLAVSVALTGLLLVVNPGQSRGSIVPDLLAVLSGLAWAAAVVVAKRLQSGQGSDLLALTAWQMLFGSLPLVAAALFEPGTGINWSASFVGALLYNVIPGNALAFLLWLFVVRNLPAGLAGMGTLCTPLFGVFCAWSILGEAPGGIEAAGMLLVGASLLLLALTSMYERRHYRGESTPS